MKHAAFAALVALQCATSTVDASDSTSYRFEWQGGNGYIMRGAMSFPSELSKLKRVFETDLACFEISGYSDGDLLGRWALGMLTHDTTWRLTFEPSSEAFVVFSDGAPMPQAWNMDGGGYNCGDPGFGFNIGNAAQDLCVDGQLIFDSQVPPSQPFAVTRDETVIFSADACRPEMLLSHK